MDSTSGKVEGAPVIIVNKVSQRQLPNRIPAAVNGIVLKDAKKTRKDFRKSKLPVAFVQDPDSPTTLVVKNLEEKSNPGFLTPKGDWVTKYVYTKEEREKFDRDSILYYFQCVINAGLGFKFTTTRLPVIEGDNKIKPLRLQFEKTEHATKVFEAYQQNVSKFIK